MAKSNRRRKLDRAKRQVRDTQKQTVVRRRQEWEQEIETAADQIRRLSNPDSPVAETAELLTEIHGGRPVSAYAVSRMMGQGWSTERLMAVADALLASGEAGDSEPSLAALTFAAQVAHAAGDPARASQLLDQALAATETKTIDDPHIRFSLLTHMRGIGRRAEAATLLEASLRDDPHDGFAAELYGVAISEAYDWASGQHAADSCTCRSGVAWEECCGPRERVVLSRFADRSGLTALLDAVGDFLSGSEYGRAVDSEVARYLAAVEDAKFQPRDLESFRAVVAEYALVSARPEPHGGPDDGEALTALEAFAADPSVPAELAARADAWREHVHYGLWKVGSEPAGTGLWCTDICTGDLRYVDFPVRFTDGWPAWSVWLGAIVPVDGIWRATGTGLRLSPAEADAAAEFIDRAVIDVVDSLVGKKRPSLRRDDSLRIGDAEPHGVLVEEQDSASPLTGSVMGVAVGQLLWRIFLEVKLHRRTEHLMGRAVTGEGWEKTWIDQPQAALGGRTPRQAADGRDQPRLEAMLRQFEYEADELAAQGQSGIDTEWLRQELDLRVLSLDD